MNIHGKPAAGKTVCTNQSPAPAGSTPGRRSVKKSKGKGLLVSKIDTYHASSSPSPATLLSVKPLPKTKPLVNPVLPRNVRNNPAIEQQPAPEEQKTPVNDISPSDDSPETKPSENQHHSALPAAAITSDASSLPSDQAISLKKIAEKPWSTFLKSVWNQYDLKPSLNQIPVEETAWLRQSFLQHIATDNSTSAAPKDINEQLFNYLPQHISRFQQCLPNTTRCFDKKYDHTSTMLNSTMQPLLSETRNFLSSQERNLLKKTAHIAERVRRMTGESPYDTLNSGGAKRPGLLKKELTNLQQSLEKKTNVTPDIRTCVQLDITHLLTLCSEQEQLFVTLQKNDFRTQEQFRKCINIQYDAVCRTLGNDTSPKIKKVRSTLLEMHSRHNRQIDQQSDFIPNLVQQVVLCNADIVRVLEHAGLDKQFNAMLAEALSETSKAFVRQQSFRINGVLHHSETSYCPAAQMRYHHPGTPPGDRDPFEHSYDGRMSPSMRRDSDSAVNLYASSLSMDGKPVEKSIRVGIPYAGAHPPEQRDAITHRRLNEVLTALLLQNKTDNGELARAMDNPHTAIDMPVCYINMMSPDALRSKGKHIPSQKVKRLMDDERKWCRETWKSMQQHWQNKTETLTIYSSDGIPHEVKVNVQPFMFICPCNMIAHNKLLALAGDAWKEAEARNSQALSQLIGSLTPGDPVEGFIGERLAQFSAEQQQEIKTLANDMRDLTRTGMRHCAEQDPFLYSRTLSSLLNTINMPVMEGCKSNKDRTGLKKAHDHAQLCYVKASKSDAIKSDFIRQHIMKESPDFAALLQQMAVNGGHTTIQTLNTAMPGYRITESVKAWLDPVYELIQRGKPLTRKQEKSLHEALQQTAASKESPASGMIEQQTVGEQKPGMHQPPDNAIDHPNRPLVPPV